MKKFKILFISYRLGYDSLLYWDELLKAIKKRFSNFRVFTAHKSLKTSDNSVSTEYKLTGIKYYHNKNKLNQKLFFLPLPLFIKDILSYKPDVIIINEFNLASFYTVLFKKFFKTSKILLLVENDPGIGIYKNYKFFRTLYRRFIVKKADKILTNNILGKRYLINVLKCEENKVKQAPYLTSVPNTDCKDRNAEKNKISLIYVGQLIERKGVIYLLKAINNLSKDIQNNIEVNIIGDGPLKKQLYEFIKKNNLNCVKMLGKIKYEKLCEYYKEADIFVLPTLYDYRALVGFEALAFGCAIVDSKYDGARFEVVEEGKNGYIVDPLNVDEFSEKLSILINNKPLLEEFKLYSLEKSKEYSSKRCAKNLVSTIEELIKGSE